MSLEEKPRKVILDLAVTLDGFIEGKNGEIDWCIMDEDMGFLDFLNQIDTILYGRKSYELWGQYRPEPGAADPEKELWDVVHRKQKYVFSRTQKRTDHSATYINDHLAEEVHKLKNLPGKDIWLYGGASLITSFIELGLVDEFRLCHFGRRKTVVYGFTREGKFEIGPNKIVLLGCCPAHLSFE